MDSSRPRRTSHGALHEAMVLGIVNVSKPLCGIWSLYNSQRLLHTTVSSYYTLFFRVRDDIEKEEAFRGLCAVVSLSLSLYPLLSIWNV